MYLRQAGSCVWFVGLSDDSGDVGAAANLDWVNAYFGTLASDFTIGGEWADLLPSSTSVGLLDWAIEFADVGELAITLRVIDTSGGFGDGYLVRAEGPTDLTVQLRDEEGCLAVLADDGEVYELILTGGWSRITPLGLLGPNQERIHPSEPFRVSGEFARGSGDCGPGRILFAETIEAMAAP